MELAAVPAPSVPGHVLGEPLGAGGTGRVWAATRSRDGHPVAVKVVPLASSADAAVAARELAVLARVDVEGLVGFHEALALDGEPPALAVVLDLVDGGSLASVVAARGRLSVGESVTVLAPVARALGELHALGVVHGDVAPGNVLFRRDGRPLLADLGVASVVGDVPGALFGTEGFVAPEVLDHGRVGAAADVYAVGALAWWCVTGRPPGPASLRPPIEEVAPGLPAAWRELTRRAMAGDPEARPTAAELALGYFDSAPCEPLRLRVGTDETSLLTQRLRDRSTDPDDLDAPGGVAALRTDRGLSAPRCGVRGGSMVRAVARAVRAGRFGRVGRRALAGVAVAAVLVAGGWVVVERTAASGHGEPGHPGAAPAPPLEHPAPASGEADPTSDPTAPRRDVRGLLAALAAQRAAVMGSGDPSGLSRLDAPGSPALASDTAALRELADAGTRYAGVRFTVASARLASATATTAVVDARVDTAAYRVVSATGTTTRRATTGPVLRFRLVWVDGRWKVAQVERPAADG